MNNDKQLKLRKLIASALNKRLDSIKIEKLCKDRRYFSRKEFYKAQIGAREFLHITHGENLEEIYNKSIQFHQALPHLSCKPVAYINDVEGDLFIQEYYEGENLDQLLSNGEVTDDELNHVLADLASILKSLEVRSTEVEARKEYSLFSEQLLACHVLSKVDRLLLGNYLLPELEHLLIGKRAYKRWTNGDLIGKNILISENRGIRIVDCEFAKCTHFYFEDWVRLKMFSNSKICESSAYLSEYGDIAPAFEAYFWLNQVVLADRSFSPAKAKEYIPKYLGQFHEIFKRCSGTFSSASLIVGGLAEKNESLCQILTQTQSALEQASSSKSALEKEIQEKSLLIEEFRCREVNSDLEKLILDKDSVIQRIHEEVESKKIILQMQQDNILKLEEQFEQTQKDLKNAEIENHILSELIVQHKGAFSKLVQVKESLRQELSLSSIQNEELKRGNMQLRDQLKEWIIGHGKLNLINEKLIDERDAFEVEFIKEASLRSDLQQKIIDLEHQITEQKQLNDNLQSNIKGLHQKVHEVEGLNHQYSNEIQSLKEQANVFLDKIVRMTGSFSWQITSPIRFLRRHIVDSRNRVTANVRAIEPRSANRQDPYQYWINTFETAPVDMGKLNTDRCISIIMPVYRPNIQLFCEAVESVIAQSYPNWELCLCDDYSQSKKLKQKIREFVDSDSRIKAVELTRNSHISIASNRAYELSTGDFIAFMDHDDLLPSNCLYEVALALHEAPHAELIYTDEDKISTDGERRSPHFKTDWNPQLLLSQNYICHFLAMSRSLFEEAGKFREGFEGSQDWDLLLRVMDLVEPTRVVHIPKVLYHWRESKDSSAARRNAKPYSVIAAEKALNDYYLRNGMQAELDLHQHGGFIPKIGLDKEPSLTVIIPTRNGGAVLSRCLASLYATSAGLGFEVLVIDNGSDEEATLQLLDEYKTSKPNFHVERDESPFNYSALNNKAVNMASTELVLLLNDDTEFLTEDWLHHVKAHAVRQEVGAVGAKLLYPNDTVQHGGVIVGLGGVAGHAFKGLPRYCTYQYNRLNLPHYVSAVTAAFLCVRRHVFLQVGGLNEEDLRIAFNDVDFCLKVRESGFNNLYLPMIEVRHYESYSRGYEDTPEKRQRFASEINYMKSRWGANLTKDPFYSPNLSLDTEKFDIRFS